MGRPEWPEVKDLFRAIIELAPEKRREALDNAPPEVRSEVEGLLQAHEEAERSIREDNSSLEGPGTRVGRYKLLQKIGEGGFGVVFMAEQREPVRRRVALKIIKRGMDTDQVVARFEAERQALALMDHPFVAKILDGGATERGRPFFVMELVKGVPITEYCDQAALSTAERLELFTQVCNAVQHAHLKGIIHRDLKPGNVLVTLHDGKPVPKVIDFGIAKATNRHLTEKTLFTEFRQMIGTPEYMAPEQAEMSSLDVDTRADIYSLGVMLYELLTGSKPFDLKSLMEKGYQEILRTIREVEPPKPSTRVSTMGEELSTVARNRHTPPKLLGRMIRGDLDWIVMRALEKDRSRRYDTASAFAADIVRHLENRPVQAGPPGRLYRLGKYARRHRTAVGATALVVVALVAGLAAALLGLAQARRAEARTKTQRNLARAATEREAEQRVRAEAGEAQAKEGEERARRGEEKAMAALGLIRSMLGAADPYRIPDPNYRVRDLLDEMSTQVSARPPGDPAVEAVVRQVLGTSYSGLGLLDKAGPHLERMIEIYSSAPGCDPVEAAIARGIWAEHLAARGRVREALTCAQEALEVLRRELGEAHLDLVASLLCIGDCLEGLGKLAEATAAVREALEICEANGGEGYPLFTDCLGSLSRLTYKSGERKTGLELLHRTLEILRRRYGEGHPATLGAQIDWIDQRGYGAALERIPAIEAELRAVLAEVRRRFAEDHPVASEALSALGRIHSSVGRIGPARDAYREALAIARRAYGENSRRVLFCLMDLGYLLATTQCVAEAEKTIGAAVTLARGIDGGRGDLSARALTLRAHLLLARGEGPTAQTLLEETLAWVRDSDAGSPLVTVGALNVLGVCQIRADALDEAERTYRECLATGRAIYGASHPALYESLLSLAEIEQQRCHLAAAVDLRRQAYDLVRRALGNDHPTTLSARSALGGALERAGRMVEAEKLLEGALADIESTVGGDHPLSAHAHLNLGLMRVGQGDAVVAEDHLRRATKLYGEGCMGGSVEFFRANWNLFKALVHQGKLEEAEAMYPELLSGVEKRFGENHHFTISCRLWGGELLLAKGDWAEAEQLAKPLLENLKDREGSRGNERAHCLELLGNINCAGGDFPGAERCFREAAEICGLIFGESHPARLRSLLSQAYTRLPQNDLEGAVEIARRVLRLAKDSCGDRHSVVATAHGILGTAAFDRRDFESAERHIRKGLALRRDLGGRLRELDPLHNGRLGYICFLRGAKRLEEGEHEAAIEALTESEEQCRLALAGLDERNPMLARHREQATAALANSLYCRGVCHQRLEDIDASDRDLQEALRLGGKVWGEHTPWALNIRRALVMNHLEMKRFESAEELARASLSRARKILPPASKDGLTVSSFLVLLGMSLLPREQWEEAETVLREALRLREENVPNSWRPHSPQSLLGECLTGQGRFDEAESLLLKAYASLVEKRGPDRQIRDAIDRLVTLYERWGKPDQAVRWREQAGQTD